MKICPRCVVSFDDSFETCPDCLVILKNKYARPGAVEQLVILYTSASGQETESVTSVLRSHKIKFFLKKTESTEAESLPARYEILVCERDAQKARHLIHLS